MQRSLSALAHKRLQNQNQFHLLLRRYFYGNHVHEISPKEEEDDEEWSNITWELTQGGYRTEIALSEAARVINSGAKPNAFALLHLARASTKLRLIPFGQQLHSYILRSGFGSNVYVSTALLNLYVRTESLKDAHNVFVEIPEPNVVSWSSLISGYVHAGQFRAALSLFLQLERSNISADAYSFTAALAASGRLSLSPLGESIHSKILKLGLELSVVVANCLLDMYGKCGHAKEAIRVFDSIVDKDIISWNSIISACARNRKLEQAFEYFRQMPESDTISYNELINGIAQFGNMEDAIQILSSMPRPNSSSWNAIITGYVNRELPWEALEFFTRMQSEDIEMDQFTFSSILSGIACLATLKWGVLVHCCSIKYGLDKSIVVGSALIDMYSKCGQVKNAGILFQSLPRKNLVTWNTIISGFAYNGNFNEAIKLFKQLKTEKDLKPDGITYLHLLLACLHNQIPLQVAMQYFESMTEEYGIEPTAEHCCSMIQLMGQRGEVWQAARMIYELGFGSSGLVWKALLGACGACGDLKVAEVAARKVIELEGHSEFVYVTMSNMYACYGKWGDVSSVRKVMSVRGLRKGGGCSWIQLETVIPVSSMVGS